MTQTRWFLGSLAFALIISASSCSHAPKSSAKTSPAHPPKLVLISVDGMRPAFYMDPEYRKSAPTLVALSEQGEKAPKGIEPIFPSITYVNHTAMVTGAYSAEHGIYNNRTYSVNEGPTEDWNWYESAIRVPTLWQVAEQAGLKVALIRWPASVGARVSWELPEIFSGNKGFNAVADWDAVRKNMDPVFLQHAIDEGPVKKPDTFADLDQIDTQAVEWLLQSADPDVIFLHFVDVDRVQHQYGTDDWQVKQSLKSVDSQIARIVKLLDPKKTTLIVTGDHGFATFTKMINLAPLIREAGIFDEVVGQADGGQAAIFVKPGGKPIQAGHEDVCRVLARTADRHEKGILKSISKRELKKLHAYPLALCALEAKIGTAFGYKTSALVIEPTDRPRGHHGYLPSHPEMRAGFMIWGKGLSHPGESLDALSDRVIRMPDIAPTAAEILGIPFHASAGERIRF
jgi:predicted AlkP superfamily pyrophosphatase or phosphodiesterase